MSKVLPLILTKLFSVWLLGSLTVTLNRIPKPVVILLFVEAFVAVINFVDEFVVQLFVVVLVIFVGFLVEAVSGFVQLFVELLHITLAVYDNGTTINLFAHLLSFIFHLSTRCLLSR